jgi:hypothetical protein
VKTYIVTFEITGSGEVEVDANSEAEARAYVMRGLADAEPDAWGSPVVVDVKEAPRPSAPPSAAPDLLVALKQCVGLLEAFGCVPGPACPQLSSAYDAIKKVQGES